jgi:hypothetical protein
MKEVHLPYCLGVNRYSAICNISQIDISYAHRMTQCQGISSVIQLLLFIVLKTKSICSYQAERNNISFRQSQVFE